MDLTGDIPAGAAAVGLLLTGGGVIAQARQRTFALAQAHISRSWSIEDDLSRDRALGVVGGADHDRYLRLCEDEYEIAKMGWIDYGIWKLWHEAIRAAVPTCSAVTDYDLLSRCSSDLSHKAYACPGLVGLTRRRRASWWFERTLVW